MKDSTPKPRTPSQNAALHLWFRLLADALNQAGWSVQRLLREKSRVDIDWDEKSVKEIIWRPIQKAVLPGKKSTTELSKLEDINKVYDHIIRFLTDPRKPVLDETIPFPKREVGEDDYRSAADKIKIDYPER